MYFGCQQGYIQESGYNFGGDNGWHDWMTFPGGDANAGVARSFPKVSEVKAAELQAHITPNVFGVVWLYQATLPLLRKSADITLNMLNARDDSDEDDRKAGLSVFNST